MPPETYKHKKTGNVYEKIGEVRAQTSSMILDMERLILYRAKDGTMWVRSIPEFNERFECLGTWRSMEEAPRDGSRFELLCKSADGVEIVVPDVKYAHAPMDKTSMILWGKTNTLSSFLTPIGWRPFNGEIV